MTGADDRGVVLDPACARLLRGLEGPPPLHRLGTHDGREALRELQDDRLEGPGVEVDLHTAPVGPDGVVGFRVVRPAGVGGTLPVVLHLHGGRWITGDADTHGHLIRALATGARAAVVVPEFTLVPEARYPVAVEEAYATLLWVVGHADELGLDPARVAVAGDCTGATTATVLAMLVQRRGGPRLAAQLLYYPWADPRCDSASHREFADVPVLSSAAARWYWEQYPGSPRDLGDATFAPARASRDDLVGLPPTLLVTAEVDVVRDEAEAYGRALRAAGVEVLATRYLGVVHDFVTLRPLRDVPAARAALREGAAFLADAFATA